jgi:hypothetical protein
MSDRAEREIIHRDLDTDAEEPAVEVAEVIADLEGKDVTAISNMWECTDHVLDYLFTNPPSPEAQMQIEFTYEEYRITVEQNGSARFIKTN